MSTTDDVAAARAALERGRDAGIAVAASALTDGVLHDLIADYSTRDATVVEAAQAAMRGYELARAVLAADALLAELDKWDSTSREDDLDVWDSLVLRARAMLGQTVATVTEVPLEQWD